MFCPFITTEAHFAFSGARIHSNNTVDMTAMIEALSFLGPRSPVTHDEQSCICHDSLHAAGNWLGTAQARTHVQLALECQQSLVHAQRRLRFTMQQVYGHSGNLVNECADHAAALGTFGLISNHNVATRWTRHNFDHSACVDGCNNISEILERLQHIRTNAMTSHQDREWRWFFSSGPPCLCALHVSYSHVFLLLSGVFLWVIVFPTSDGPTFFIRVYRTEYRRLLRVQYVESSIGTAFSRAGEWYCRLLSRGNRRGQDRNLLSLCS